MKFGIWGWYQSSGRFDFGFYWFIITLHYLHGAESYLRSY